MADLGGVFDANAVQPTSFDVVPAGEYEAVITNSEMKPTLAGTGRYLNLTLQILNGPCQNRKVFDKLNLDNPSDKAVQIARGTLSAICRAVGVLTPKDSSELHDKPLRIKVAVTKSDEFGEQNLVKAYKPRNAGPIPPSTMHGLPTFPPPPNSVSSAPPPAASDDGSPW